MQVIMKKIRSKATFLMLLVFMFIIFFRSSYSPLTDHFTALEGLNRIQWTIKMEPETKPVAGAITCNRSHSGYDLCSISGPTLLDPRASTLYGLGNADISMPSNMKIRPYPRKRDKTAMSKVEELTLTSATPKVGCDVAHRSPALVFSAGGYTGNFFHDLTDGLVPLFVTVHTFFPDDDRDIVLVIADCKDWWARKYAKPLSLISCHPIINLNRENSTTHCFPSSIVGLVTHGTMTVDPTLLPHPKTLSDFRTFMKNALIDASKYDHKNIVTGPRAVLVTRRSPVSRVIVNEKQVVELAERIGFEVVVVDPTRGASLEDACRVIDASQAMIGVHGAGLAHEVCLRAGSVLVQVVPIAAEWASKDCFEKPGRALGLEYIEYKIEANESSLLEKYGESSLVIREPKVVVKGNWTNMRLYLKDQDVKLDLVRFGGYLRMAYEKAKRFMEIYY